MRIRTPIASAVVWAGLCALVASYPCASRVHAQAKPTPAAPAPAAEPAPTPALAPEVAADPEAADKANAKALFEKGVAAYGAGSYEDALASFQEAFRVRPHPLVRVNIANCYDKLGKPLEALFHFEQFLAADSGSPLQRQEVVTAMERLRKQVGQALLRVTPDGALVTVDRGEQRRAPIMDPMSLQAGSHEVQVELSGYKTLNRTFTIDGGTTVELNLVLERDPAAVTPVAGAPISDKRESIADAPPPETSGSDKASGAPPYVWIIGAASAAFLLAAGVTGVLALDAESDFDQALRARQDPNASPLARVASYQEALDAADRADALALTTDILLIGAVAGAAVTTVLIVTQDGDEAHPAAQASALISPELIGARIAGRF